MRKKQLRVLSEQEILKGNFMPTSITRAQRLMVKEDYETTRHKGFQVTDPVSGSEHLVIFKNEKQPPLDWTCDCEWYTTKTIHNGKYCAHILAVHLFITHAFN